MRKIVIDINSLSSASTALNKAIDENNRAINKINASINIIGSFSMPNKANYINELEKIKKDINKNNDILFKYISMIKKASNSFGTKDHNLRINCNYSFNKKTNVNQSFSLRNENCLLKTQEISSILVGGAAVCAIEKNETKKGLFDWIGDGINNIGKSIENTWNNFVDGCKKVEDSVSNYFSNEWNNFKEAINVVFGEETVSYAWETTKDILKGAASIASIAVAVSTGDALKLANETYKLCNYFTATVNDISASICSLQANYASDNLEKERLLNKAKNESEINDLSDYFRANGMKEIAASFDVVDTVSSVYGAATGVDKLIDLAANGFTFTELLEIAGKKKIDPEKITTYTLIEDITKEVNFVVEGTSKSIPYKIGKGIAGASESTIEFIEDIIG